MENDQVGPDFKEIDRIARMPVTPRTIVEICEDTQARPQDTVAAPEHIPVLYLKITNPCDDDVKEAAAVLQHWRPNFEIVKTNLRDCLGGA
jgi:hypothetical protein